MLPLLCLYKYKWPGAVSLVRYEAPADDRIPAASCCLRRLIIQASSSRPTFPGAAHDHPSAQLPSIDPAKLERLAETAVKVGLRLQPGQDLFLTAPVVGQHELFGFLTTEANAIVVPIHPKAMPVILTSPAEVDLWLEGQTPDALKLQRPLPDAALKIVAKGEKEDRASEAA